MSDEDVWEGDSPTDEASISALAEELVEAKSHLVKLEEAVVLQKQKVKRIEEVQLPDAMIKARHLSRTLMDGTVINVELHVLNWGIPEGKEQEAFAFVRKTGHGDIIKHVLTTALDRGDDHLALRIVQGIRAAAGAAGNRIEVTDRSSIHHQTLGKYVRDRLAEKVALPEETFGVYRRNVAKVTPPKKKETPF